MTTELDLKFQPKVWALVARVGIDATFYTYPSLTIDKSQSTVTKGTAVTFTAKITPPEQFREKLAGASIPGESGGLSGSPDEQSDKFKTFLASGVGQSPIGFTPELGMRVDFSSKSWRILMIDTIQPGDDVLGWDLVVQE